jgi:hypothetical protein
LEMDRRYFIHIGCAASVMLCLPKISAATNPPAAPPSAQNGFKQFSDHLKTVFSVDLKDGQRVKLLLSEVRAGHSNPKIENFSIRFEGPPEPSLKQGSYLFRHEKLGRQEIFIVPGVTSGQKRSYHAIFNNLVGWLNSLDQLSLATFAPRIGKAFQIAAPGQTATEARLTSVRSLGSHGARESFSLLFSVAGWKRPQGIVTLSQEHFGSFEIFVVPVGADPQGMQLEAVFNFAPETTR